jgi:hypothetical protein
MREALRRVRDLLSEIEKVRLGGQGEQEAA